MKTRRSILMAGGFLLAALILFLAIRARQPASIPAPGDFPLLSLEGKHKLLVLSPHCDDETLGAGGLIQEALRQGIEVRVVIATNGDGFLFATMEQFRRIYPHPSDFVRMGSLRQQESLAALKILGLPASNVIFLSYPDRGTPALWNEHWSSRNPYRSPFSDADRSPYPLTYDKASVYSGENYLKDLRSILETYRPDLIVYPHPDDAHPDHWGLSAFTRLALAMMEHDDPSYQPDAYAYLIHRPDFPRPKGFHPEAGLAPPAAVYGIFPDWVRVDLSQDETNRKWQAIQAYRTQIPFLRGLLVRFVRQDEPFSRVQPANLPRLAQGDSQDPPTWLDAGGQPVKAVQYDPVHDYLSRNIVAAADLVALYAARKQDGDLAVCMQIRSRPEPTLAYTLRLLAVSNQGIVHEVARNAYLRQGWQLAGVRGQFICSNFGWASLGSPWLLFLGADTEELGFSIVDQSAWQIVK